MANKSDEINQRVEEQTGFGTYVVKDLISTGSVLAGMAAGFGLGYLASRTKIAGDLVKRFGNWMVKDVSAEVKEVLQLEKIMDNDVLKTTATTMVGMFGGAFVGAVPHTYLHWREQKRLQLRTEELANDAISLREQRNAIVGELNAQAASIRGQNTAIEKILAQGPTATADRKTNPSKPLDRLHEERSTLASSEAERS